MTFARPDGAGRVKTEFKSVPGMGPETTGIGGALAVSAEMADGKAKIRVVDSNGRVMGPGPVTFAATGSNAFIFWADDSSNGIFTVEWKRIGSERAKASTFAAHIIGNDF